MTWLFLHFSNEAATFGILSTSKKPVSQLLLSHFLTLATELRLVRFGGGASYIWTTLLITVHTFAAVIISLHTIKKRIWKSLGGLQPP